MPTFTFIGKPVAAGNTTSIGFSNIPQIFDDLRLIIAARSTTSNNDLYITFNGDSGNNYQYAQFFYNNSGATVPGGSGTTSNALAILNQSAYAAGTFAINDLYIPQYKEYILKNIYGSASQVTYDNASIYNKFVGSTWVNSSLARQPITSITIASSSGNLAQYSNATLYGIKRS